VNLLENIRQSLRNVKDNLLRSILTMMIIAFGIMALVGILTAIDSILISMSSNFSGLGANSFAITPLDSDFGPRHRGMRKPPSKPITYDNAIDFAAAFGSKAMVSISGSAMSNSTVAFESTKTNPNINVVGVNADYLTSSGYTIEVGRSFSNSELLYGSNVCLLGSQLVTLLFRGNSSYAVDKIVSIDGNKFKVVGVLDSKGSSMTSSGDKMVFIPLLTQRKYFAYHDQGYDLNVSVGPQAEVEEVVSQATGIMRNVRKLRVVDKNDFSIQKSDAIMNVLKDNTTMIRLATIAIGFITLIGAAIGLMNIMLVSVTDRTREIGIRKALGATKSNILIQFLIEAMVICQLGGLIGIVLGILAGNFITLFTKSTFLIPWGWISLGVITCIVVGLIAGIYPAMKAARLDPVDSLRYE